MADICVLDLKFFFILRNDRSPPQHGLVWLLPMPGSQQWAFGPGLASRGLAPSPEFKGEAHEGWCQDRVSQNPSFRSEKEGRLPGAGFLLHNLEGVFLWQVRIRLMSKEARMVEKVESQWRRGFTPFSEPQKTVMPEASSFWGITTQETVLFTTASSFSADARCSINFCWVVKKISQ